MKILAQYFEVFMKSESETQKRLEFVRGRLDRAKYGHPLWRRWAALLKPTHVSRSTRRVAVILSLGGYTALTAFGISSNHISWSLSAILVFMAIWYLLFTWSTLTLGRHRRLGLGCLINLENKQRQATPSFFGLPIERDAIAFDEREMLLRHNTFVLSYRWINWLNLGIFVYTGMATFKAGGIYLWVPETSFELVMSFMAYAFLVAQLPQMVLAWTDPDSVDEE